MSNGCQWGEHAMLAALRVKFGAPEFAFLSHVRNGTGFGRKPRTIDALAMSLWPSRGIDLHGFEIKISRSDWIKEKRSPEKSDEIGGYCDFFWLAVSNPAIVQTGELPAAWGLVTPKGAKLAILKQADRLTPKPLTKTFLGAALRRTSETNIGTCEINSEIERRCKEAVEISKRGSLYEIESLKRELQELRGKWADLENQIGVKLDGWKFGSIAEAFKLVSNCRVDTFKMELADSLNRLRDVARICGEQLASLDKPDPAKNLQG
jgi:hypothetical protein